MRLIGGNISDTPVKEVGDGSAFNVGGAAGAPDLIEMGTIPTTGTELSNIDESYQGFMGNGQVYSNIGVAKWSDNSYGVFWFTKNSPHELFYCHVQTNANGTFASEGSKVDLEPDLAATDSTGVRHAYQCIDVKKVSASRVIVAVFVSGGDSGGPWRAEELLYDKNGDTLTEVGSVFSHGTSALDSANSGSCRWVALKDADHGISFWENQASVPLLQTTYHGTPIHVTATKTAGTSVVASSSYQEGNGGTAFTDNTGQIFTIAGTSSMGSNTMKEWTVSTGSTPSCSVANISGWQMSLACAYGSPSPVQSDGGFDGGGGLGATLINRNDIERGRFIAPVNNGDHQGGSIGVFGGVTTNNSFNFKVSPMGVHGTDWGDHYHNSKLVEVDYNTDTYWGRYVLVSASNGGDIFFCPFNFNWSTYAYVLTASGDLPKAVTDVTTRHHDVWMVMHGNSAATHLCVIFDEDTAGDIRYVNVPLS